MNELAAFRNKPATHYTPPAFPNCKIVRYVRKIDKLTQLTRNFLRPVVSGIRPSLFKKTTLTLPVPEPELSLRTELLGKTRGLVRNRNDTKHQKPPRGYRENRKDEVKKEYTLPYPSASNVTKRLTRQERTTRAGGFRRAGEMPPSIVSGQR